LALQARMTPFSYPAHISSPRGVCTGHRLATATALDPGTLYARPSAAALTSMSRLESVHAYTTPSAPPVHTTGLPPGSDGCTSTQRTAPW